MLQLFKICMYGDWQIICFTFDLISLNLFQSCGDFDFVDLMYNLSLDIISFLTSLVMHGKLDLLLLNLLGTNFVSDFKLVFE